jgi:hypothetical protein
MSMNVILRIRRPNAAPVSKDSLQRRSQHSEAATTTEACGRLGCRRNGEGGSRPSYHRRLCLYCCRGLQRMSPLPPCDVLGQLTPVLSLLGRCLKTLGSTRTRTAAHHVRSADFVMPRLEIAIEQDPNESKAEWKKRKQAR